MVYFCEPAVPNLEVVKSPTSVALLSEAKVNLSIKKPAKINEIPFLPIDFFKSEKNKFLNNIKYFI
mgnify:CR=1 FL=1